MLSVKFNKDLENLANADDLLASEIQVISVGAAREYRANSVFVVSDDHQRLCNTIGLNLKY